MPQNPGREFLQVCRLVLKGDLSRSELEGAVQTARANLSKLKADFLADAPLSAQGFEIQKETDEILASIQRYSGGVDLVEAFLRNNNKEVLAQGMEQVRRAIGDIETGLHHYQAALLSFQGPTDMPAYNLLARDVREYRNKKISRMDLESRILGAQDAVRQSLQSITPHLHLKEVQTLKEIYETHLKTLERLKSAVAGSKLPAEALSDFRKNSELLREALAAAQIKILTETPTPSAAANLAINTARETLSGKIHPRYFEEGIKRLKKERGYILSELQKVKAAGPDAKTKAQIQRGEEFLKTYDQALRLFVKFGETRDAGQASKASILLEKAVFGLYDAFKALQNPRQMH